MGEDPSRIREEIADTRARMGETVEALSYKTDVPARTRDAISDRKDAVIGKVTGMKDAIVGQAGSVGGTVGDALPSTDDIQQTARQAVGIAQRNPLGLALGAVALGFLTGMVVPSTRMEDERLGAAADQVKNRIAETGQQALEHGKAVAQDTLESAKQTAQESGQTHAGQLAETAQGNARDGAQEAASAVTL